MLRFTARCTVILGLTISLFLLLRQARAEPTQSQLMEAKLLSAQKVLEGLAVTDFDAVAEHAEKLRLLSQESAWKVLQTTEYDNHSRAFRESARRLGEAATDQNADAAGLAYVQLTLSCFDCHKHIRAQSPQSINPRTPDE